MMRSSFPRVELLENSENRGFAAANNQALKFARGKFMLLLNPDTELLPDVLSATIAYLRSHPDVGIVGCKILYPNGSVQQSARELPTLWTLFLENTLLYKFLPHSGLFRNPWITDTEKEQEVDVVKGAFFLTKRETLDSVGLFDERFFLYSEEQDWCFRAKQKGWRIVYLPVAGITHYEGGSSQPGCNSGRLLVYDSEYEYYKKHFGKTYAILARVIMFLGVLLRLILWSSILVADRLRLRPYTHAKERSLLYWYALIYLMPGFPGTRRQQMAVKSRSLEHL